MLNLKINYLNHRYFFKSIYKSICMKFSMRKTIVFLVSYLFCVATVFAENDFDTDSRFSSESEISAVNSVSTDSVKTVVIKDSVLKSDTLKLQSTATSAGQIVVEKGRYKLNGKALKRKELKQLLNSVPESAFEFKKAQAQVTYEILTLVGLEIVLVATTGYYMGALPCLLVALPFGLAAEKHEKEAIRLYNLKHGADIVNTVSTYTVPKPETIHVAPATNNVKTTASNQFNVGDRVSFYDFKTNTVIKADIIEIKDKTVVVEYSNFDKKYTSELQLYDVKKLK